ncbi:hypothetical protein IQ06DRAFT_342551 [Phaeosphaeriaceae sp. SRC1lsM3a]|nr:hypothetical protein IQ06DRAFT_342551 [Stagonospora sp. SRC1lsM3a]
MSEIGSMADTAHTDVTDSTFAFDDLIVDSKVYRRVLAHATSTAQLSLKEGTKSRVKNAVDDAQAGEEGGTPRNWSEILQDFCSSMEQNVDLQKTKERAKVRPVFKEFEEEVEAITKWFIVLSCDERKYSLETLANIAKIDLPKMVALEPGRAWRLSGIVEKSTSGPTEPPPGWI